MNIFLIEQFWRSPIDGRTQQCGAWMNDDNFSNILTYIYVWSFPQAHDMAKNTTLERVEYVYVKEPNQKCKLEFQMQYIHWLKCAVFPLKLSFVKCERRAWLQAPFVYGRSPKYDGFSMNLILFMVLRVTWMRLFVLSNWTCFNRWCHLLKNNCWMWRVRVCASAIEWMCSTKLSHTQEKKNKT